LGLNIIGQVGSGHIQEISSPAQTFLPIGLFGLFAKIGWKEKLEMGPVHLDIWGKRHPHLLAGILRYPPSKWPARQGIVT
jgi:hypothetical protein